MQKELLLAISDDRAASYNLRFLKDVYENVCDLKLTLFYVAPKCATWGMNENDLVPTNDDLEQLMAHKKDKGAQALNEAVRWLADMTGCDGNVRTKVVHSRKGSVLELIDEARSGLYDALVLGRKGFTWFEEAFENSVCHELIWQDIDFPIWICKRPSATPRRDVLLCMDGSDAALRMADHAAYMLADEQSHEFTLFHVARHGYESARSGRIFDEALAILAENGVHDERIELKMVTGKNVVKAILKETANTTYAAVGVGRHGTTQRTKKEKIFPSTVAVNLLRQLSDTALWISK